MVVFRKVIGGMGIPGTSKRHCRRNLIAYPDVARTALVLGSQGQSFFILFLGEVGGQLGWYCTKPWSCWISDSNMKSIWNIYGSCDLCELCDSKHISMWHISGLRIFCSFSHIHVHASEIMSTNVDQRGSGRRSLGTRKGLPDSPCPGACLQCSALPGYSPRPGAAAHAQSFGGRFFNSSGWMWLVNHHGCFTDLRLMIHTPIASASNVFT